MKKQEKLDKYVQEFIKLGKGEKEAMEEAKKLIPYGQEDYLTMEQLKIKFDYPNMDGEYPNWITPEEHYQICLSVANTKYDYKKFGWFLNKQELVSKLYIWSRIRLNKFNSINHLKVGLFNACKNILRDQITKETRKGVATTEDEKYYNRVNGEMYMAGSLDDVVSQEDGKTTYKEMTPIKQNEIEAEEFEMVQRIHNIKNTSVRHLLIACGYLLAKIDTLENDYNEVLNTCTPEVMENLHRIQEQVYRQEDIKNFKSSGMKIQVDRKKNKKVTFKDIISAFGNNYFGMTNSREYTYNVVTELKDYINFNLFDGLGV